jgi:hypothetical protein
MSIEKRQEQLSAWGFFSLGGTSNSPSLTESKSSGTILMRFCFWWLSAAFASLWFGRLFETLIKVWSKYGLQRERLHMFTH